MLYLHVTGRSGVISIRAMVAVVLTMGYEPLRKHISYELRKGAHFSLARVAGSSIAFHAPSSHIGSIMFVTIGAYVLDYLYCMFVLTCRLETSHFWRLEHGVQLSISNPAGWRDITGYVYLNIPWIAKKEWHAFSVYPHPKVMTSPVCASPLAVIGQLAP